MIKLKNLYWLLPAFALFSIANIYSVATNWQTGIYATKPLILTFLSLLFFSHCKNSLTPFSKFILAGLVCSIAGDSFLMFAQNDPVFFLIGLSSFLFAHLCYITAFIKYPKFDRGKLISNPWIVIPVIIYLISFIWYLLPDLPNDFKIPVIIYGAVISTMLTLSINMIGRATAESTKMLIAGAVLFVISDSIIAIGKFKEIGLKENVLGLLIMTTYIIGQYLIARSSIKLNTEY